MHEKRWRFPESVKYTLILAIISTALSGCSDDPATGEGAIITSVSPSLASSGDTVTIEGSGFSSDPSRNQVAFSATGYSDLASTRLAIPFYVTGSSIRALVPEGSYTGEVRVEAPLPFGGGPFDMPAPRMPSNSLDFSVRLLDGEVAKLFFASIGFHVPVSTEQVDEDYMLILFSSADPPDKDWTVLYSVDSDLTCKDMLLDNTEQDAATEMVSSVKSFERKKREEIINLLRGGQVQVDGDAGIARTDVAALQPASREFFVYNNIYGNTIDPASFTEITADLKYEGAHTLLYLDSSTHFSCISDSEAEALGMKFENDIYPTNTSSFGSVSDINRDEKVVILLTPVVNELTPEGPSPDGVIAGFFLPGDLLPTYVPTGATNGMEIYYSMVPDPNGLYGNAYTEEYALNVMEGVMAHEFQHMIMFNYRVLIFGSGYSGTYMAELWVDEGLAHIAEDLNGHDADNIDRSNIFLADPGEETLIHGGDDLGERGASFLFFRYLGDRFDEDIFRAIVQTKKTGTDNIEYVTGYGFKELFSDWAATLYFESEGITPADPKYSYSSIDLQTDFNPLSIKGSNLCIGPVNGFVKSMGPEFIRLGFSGIDDGDFTITCDALGRMNAVLLRIQ